MLNRSTLLLMSVFVMISLGYTGSVQYPTIFFWIAICGLVKILKSVRSIPELRSISCSGSGSGSEHNLRCQIPLRLLFIIRFKIRIRIRSDGFSYQIRRSCIWLRLRLIPHLSSVSRSCFNFRSLGSVGSRGSRIFLICRSYDPFITALGL